MASTSTPYTLPPPPPPGPPREGGARGRDGGGGGGGHYHRLDHTTLEVERSHPGGAGAGSHLEYGQEEKEEEYFYIHPRPLSRGSESATTIFLTDDRVKESGVAASNDKYVHLHHDLPPPPHFHPSRGNVGGGGEGPSNGGRRRYEEEEYLREDQRVDESGIWRENVPGERGKEVEEIVGHQKDPGPSRGTARDRIQMYEHQELDQQQQRGSRGIAPTSQVDYSPRDFSQARAVIDAAARSKPNGGPPHSSGNVRVKQVGDTTIITEHRDPYSFYWQLDQFKKKPVDPPRRIPPVDYVIDEEMEEEQDSPMPQEHSVLSPDSHDSGVNMESHYSRPQKEETVHRILPAGWEKHEDPSGFSYYWHVDSGTIQRDPPIISQRPIIIPEEPPPQLPVQTAPLQIPPPPPQQPVIEEHAFRQTTTKRRIENQDESSDNEGVGGGNAAAIGNGNVNKKPPTRFMVRSLGWVEVPEEELTAERSSNAVNRAIAELSSTSSKASDSIRQKWNDGKELILELDERELALLDPENNMNVIHKNGIQQIRVWGVGKDNARDFAFVARDRNSRRFLCHVFRCDSPAKVIANTLKDICKRLMTQRERPASFKTTPEFVMPEKRITKESLLLTPIDEPKRIIRCHFIGVTQVPKATGIEVLNEAVDRLVKQVRLDRWVLCDVSIAPSKIVITEINGNQIALCRVRYLSFLGIAQDIKHCAFIMHTSSESFMCYVFHVEPSAGGMAKTIEAACKLRYQKVLDAHMNRNSPLTRNGHHLNGFG